MKLFTLNTAYWLGVLLYKQQKWAAATVMFKQAVDQIPHHAAANFKLGMCHLKQKQWIRASHYINQAVELAPKNTAWHVQQVLASAEAAKSSTSRKNKNGQIQTPIIMGSLANELGQFFGKGLMGLSNQNGGFNVWKIAHMLASFKSAEYLTKRMLTAKIINSRKQMELYAPTTQTIDGLCLEFGVANGTSINRIASVVHPKKVYGFDGFKGLPETWKPDHPKGKFAQPIPKVAENVELVVGWFDQTLKIFLDEHSEDISFIHVDCDLYSSTKTIFDFVGHRIKPGTVILFDEYFNYPGWECHEYKAFAEFVKENNIRYEYVAFTANNKQVLIRILE